MKRFFSKIVSWIGFLGIDFRKMKYFLRTFPGFLKDLNKMKRLLRQPGREPFKIKRIYPVLGEKYAHSTIPWNYFFQDLWVAQLILKHNPVKHVDVGSRIDGFVAHVAAFREIEVYDIRVVRDDIPNVHFVQADVCSEDFSFTDYCDSVSSLHVIEHLGLGRYGDQLDPDAHIKGLRNITKALKTGGLFYLSVPVGDQRMEFNAHRVFSTRYILETLGPYYKPETFGLVDDNAKFYADIPVSDPGFDNSFNCHYGCGIFVFKKTGNWL